MIYHLPNNSVVAVHDIFDPLPEFMRRADCVFTDIPYNQSMLTNYSHRENVTLSASNLVDFDAFIERIIGCVKAISPAHCFIEVGKEALIPLHFLLGGVYRYVTFYNSTYHRRPQNKCYILHATNDSRRRRYSGIEDMDEADAISWVCQHHPYQCIGDLCMGRGLVGLAAYRAGKPFVGTELNQRRLACLLAAITHLGGQVTRQEEKQG